ncbi:hypothetical protein BRD09_02885 [Halobacteriales archaeon SW_10_68_16]|nr:MAG: hypothetical protein BRD09_02885 [Halobacteriales archaeon SW_10_68_16]
MPACERHHQNACERHLVDGFDAGELEACAALRMSVIRTDQPWASTTSVTMFSPKPVPSWRVE